jgi:hypothetical protein
MTDRVPSQTGDVHSPVTASRPSRPPDLNEETLRALICRALEEVRDEHANSKRWKGECADYCGVHPRTVEHWLYGEKVPGGFELACLVRWLGGRADAIRELMGNQP